MTLAEPVARCGFRLTELAEELELAAARAAVAVPAGWLGTAGAHYREALSDCERDVRTVASAYGQAGEALLPYARALLDVEALEQQASTLRDRASTETAVAALTGGADEGAALRLAADRLQQEAQELERTAATRCAALLHELAARAPRARSSSSAWRFVSDAVSVGVGALTGTAALGSRTVRALGGESGARHELTEQALAMMRVWETPVQMWHDLLDGRPGLVLGAAPFLGRMPKGVIRDPHLAHREALREALRRDVTAAATRIRPTVWEMAHSGVSLASEEARGGHALREHAAATRAYLLARNREKRPFASTFTSPVAAEHWVNAVLRRRAGQIGDVYSLPEGDLLELEWTFPDVVGWGTARRTGRSVTAHTVRVLVGLEGGAPHVVTAYPVIVPR